MPSEPVTPQAFATHEVFNQAPPLENFNRFTSDVVLQEAVERNGGAGSGWLIGEEGRGVHNIIEMATYTRLDCAVATAGMMRAIVAEAMHHCAHRTVFQKHLIDQPLMANVLADLLLETEAATALCFSVARSFDRAHNDDGEAAFRRIMTLVAKYWVCKRAPNLAYEAMECLGGDAGDAFGTLPVGADLRAILARSRFD